MKRNSAGCQIERRRNLFHRLALGEQLQHFDLPIGERDLFVGAGCYGIGKEFCRTRSIF